MGLNVLCYDCDSIEDFTVSLWLWGEFSISIDWWSNLDRWQQNILVLITPLLVVVPLWLKLVNLLDKKRKSQVVDSESREVYIPRHFVIKFSQDEANQWLSLLVNFLSLLQQALYNLILWGAKVTARIRVFDFLWDQAWKIFRIVVLIPTASLGIFYVVLSSIHLDWNIFDLINFLFFSGEDLEFIVTVLSWQISSSDWMTSVSVLGSVISVLGWIVLIFGGMVVIVGIVCLSAILLMLIFGVFRVILLMCNGVISTPRNLEDLVDALLGSVSISTNPIGYSQTLVLQGTHLFNHTRIYDEPDTIRLIAEIINEFITSQHSVGSEN